MANPPGAPDFSPIAATYARVRPRYPDALYAWLAALVAQHELAWDCATGNGQAAAGVAAHFRQVVATDRSAEQLRHAPALSNVEYRLADAAHSGLAPASVDLVTIAAALHWVDHAAFAAEVRRVARAGAVLAAWSYHTAEVEPPFDGPFHRAYWDILKPHFAPQTDLVDRHYAGIPLPGEPIAVPPFAIEVAWTLADCLDYVRTWSGAHAYRERTGHDAAEDVRAELEAIYGEGEGAMARRVVRIPIFVQARRL
jgi:hypothetical protein